MTSFRLLCCLCLLLICCSVGVAGSAEEATSVSVSQLQQDNAALQHQVRRLEAQVTALRDEMNKPDATQVFAGIGYIVGVFGVAGWVAARKKNGKGD